MDAPRPPAGGGSSARYQRSMSGMIGAMVIVVVVAAGFVLLNWLNNGDQSQPVASVDYQPWVRAGRDDGKLQLYAPPSLPSGWRATSASYSSGTDPRWHLGVLAAGGGYVGVEEALEPAATVLHRAIDASPTRHGSAVVGGTSWQVWRDGGGDYALVRELGSRIAGKQETLLVGGSAKAKDVRRLAASLTTGGSGDR